MRINGFEQIKGFYSWVFSNQDKQIRSTHISLYMFLVNQNNRNNWVEWFKCPFDLAMGGSGISNKKTYYNTLLDLQDWKLLEYVKGVNNFKAPLIKLEVLFDTSTVPQSEPQLQPQVILIPEPLLQPQLYNNIKLLTSNLKPITLNIKKVLEFLKKDSLVVKKTIEERKTEFKNSLTPFLETYDKSLLNDFYGYWTEHGINDKKMKWEKQKSFGISRRLSTWAKNDKRFNNDSSKNLTAVEKLNLKLGL
jgi:hypothetical protein